MIKSENVDGRGARMPAAVDATEETMPPTPQPAHLIDVAALPPGGCRATIEGTFEALHAGEDLEIVVDHDPLPLRRRFDVERPGQSRWTYLEAGPVTWRVRVERIG